MEPKSSQAIEGEAPTPLEVETDTTLPLFATGNDSLFQSTVRAGIADELIDYSARYSVESGELMRTLGANRDASRSVPTEVGRQSLRQKFRLSLPSYLGSPVRVGFDNQRDIKLALDGEQKKEATRAHLQWEPDPLALDVEWTPPRDQASVGRPLDCLVNGNVRLPAVPMAMNMNSAVDISQQQCLVRAPDRGLDRMNLQTQGLAWRWGEDLDSAVRMHRVVPQWQGHGMPPADAGYEVGLRHGHSFFGWRMEADVALRQTREQGYESDANADSHWAVDLLMRRELKLFALTARWMQSKDPLWFVPMAKPIGNERMSILLDFSEWLKRTLPKLDANMSASWEHAEGAGGSDENHIKWNVSVFW